MAFTSVGMKEKEVEDTETTTSTRASETALKAARYKIYDKDFPDVKKVHAKILGLPEGEVATQQVLDSLPTFQLRRSWLYPEVEHNGSK